MELKTSAMEEGGILLQLYELEYSDLMFLSSDQASSSSLSPQEMGRMESITRTVMENLGPTGPGLLAITGVPNASNLRRKLLPLARKLALLSNEDRKRVLKEHSLGSDVPLKNLDRSVSSFAMQLKYVQAAKCTEGKGSHVGVDSHNMQQVSPDAEKLGEMQDSEFRDLRNTFKELGFCMIEVGLGLARICDRVIGGREIEQSLLESCTAKGRLIHYHSPLDNFIMKETTRKRGSTKVWPNGSTEAERSMRNEQSNFKESGSKSCGSRSNLWQQWHYDYGIFTVLTAPMFILPCHPQTSRTKDSPCDQICPYPGGSTYLQIFDPNKNIVLTVKASPECFIVQVGESADILSKGKLRSTLHCVCRHENLENLSRETFVVFLQPAWSKTLSLSDHPIEHFPSSCQHSGVWTKETESAEKELGKTIDIHKIVPSLSSRLKDEMTFAEFSRETTRQYYGPSGFQPNRS
ncbi:unnamed protein product [Ilex paraguariensis]|uniref:Isopenicillin N synthase-like Fe(2+) 2OG dioxygenase domain-containing protein n=1 Tax=Ilex paraguariensis TaxID=185542 RepID=A0ABC8R296_9AQUA